MHSFLIRFIDLGLLLLMAFLATAELSPIIQVPLPHGDASASPESVYRIEFDETNASVRRDPTGTMLCQPTSLEGLTHCLQSLGEIAAPFLVSPTGEATVQRLVDVMDICLVEGFSCSVSP